MSQIGVSRPATQASQQRIGPVLPEIQHPLSRLSNPGNLDVRGISRGACRPSSLPPSKSGRPLGNEGFYTPRKSNSAFGKDVRKSVNQESTNNVPIESIPEGIEVTQGDLEKVRMPIFGNRAEYNDPQNRVSARLSRPTTVARIEIDEIESILKERINNNYYDTRKRFKDNDPEGKGNVSREALYRIIITLGNKEVNMSQFNRLMDRLDLRDKTIINFSEFFSKFREMPTKEYPKWMDPINRQTRVTMNASQVHANLKEKARRRFMDLADLMPQFNPDGGQSIELAEFKQMLNKYQFYMEEDEFAKLWEMYDPHGVGTLDGVKFLNRLGISWNSKSAGHKGHLSPRKSTADNNATRALKKKEIERKQSMDIEIWLKNKFRQGFFKLKESFEAKDPDKRGVVTFDQFLEILTENELTLDKSLLAAFLSRCGVQARRDGVPYRDFLHRFQDRGEDGVTHNVLTNKNHAYHKRDPSPETKLKQENLGAVESQLINMFQRDFLHLLGKFQSIDKYGLNVISQEEFRAVIESTFHFDLTEAQFRGFIENVPLDDDGNIKYPQFMSQFDSKGQAPSLFPKQTALSKERLPSPRQASSPEPNADILEVRHDSPRFPEEEPQRSHQEIFRIIKDLLTKRYQELEAKFYELDEINSRRLSQETMYQLLKRFDIQPEITRGEIRGLWKTFITNSDRTLEFLQFVRHFGFSLKSGAFPNAKLNPPRRGDADFMIRSRKLNCAADMLQDSLRSKIDYLWEDLRKEFVEMDPYRTGLVSQDEFQDVLKELCVHLSDFELNFLTEKFDIKKDGRVSYVEFLKPFAMRRQQWRHGNDMLALLNHTQSELPVSDIVEPPQKGLTGITSKLRQKISGDWKNMRRAFRKLDSSNSGLLTMAEFRSVLKLANIILNDEEVYNLLEEFDTGMTGKIQYDKFIDDTFKPESRRSVNRKPE